MTMHRIYRRAVKAAQATKLPGVEQSMWYGTPSLAVKGKSFMRVKDADTFVFRCALDEKEVLMEAGAKVYFETDHYKGWPAVLVRRRWCPMSNSRNVSRAPGGYLHLRSF
jgi:hypothetical protein